MALVNLVKIDKNGSKHFEGMITCDRCGGQGGSDAWQYTGYTCYKCGGTGKVFAKWIERTPEYEAKLAERRAAKIRARAAQDAEKLAELEKAREAQRIEREREEARIKAQKAISQYIGVIGEKIEIEACYEKTAYYDTKIGWKEQRMYVHTFKTVDGNKVVWKTSSGLGRLDLQYGEPVRIKATVKDHSEYQEEKQTALLRCKIERV